MQNTNDSINNSEEKILDVIIVGGGLSGLFLAHQLQQSSAAAAAATPALSWALFEARSTLGGRLQNQNGIDMGGAWVWLEHQPNLRRLLLSSNELFLSSGKKIELFSQPGEPSSTRISGGAFTMIERLQQALPSENIHLNASVIKCKYLSTTSKDGNNLIEIQISPATTTTTNDSISNRIYYAKQVVIAAAPKIVSKHIVFDPPLSVEKQKAMDASHTWMAGVTKLSLVYDTKFWSDDNSYMGLKDGPAFQMYDASDGTVQALTFFTLVSTPNMNKRALAAEVISQLAKIWKRYYNKSDCETAKLANYTDVYIQSWPNEEFISEDSYPTHIHPHPIPVQALAASEWNNQLLFAGTETDQDSPGVMEGAIGAALRVYQTILQTCAVRHGKNC